MSPRTYSGRECWVYRCQSAGELCGHHTELIATALSGSEPEYLLYSPLRDTGRGPFHITGQSGSHAVALSNGFLIVSRDTHRADAPRSVRRIALSDIVTLSVGEALTLGWLVVRFVDGNRVEQEVVFFQSSGMTHFRDLVRLWIARLSRRNGTRHGVTKNTSVATSSPAYIAEQLDPLIAAAEDGAVFHAPESWEGSHGRRHCRCASTSVAVSSSVVLLAESERPLRPGMLMFGVNVICIPRSVLAHVRVDVPECAAESVASLTMVVSSGGVGDRIERDLAIDQDTASRLLAQFGSRAVAEGAA